MPVAQLLSELQQNRSALFAPLRGMSDERFRLIPMGEAWSIATHLAHVLRCERMLVERAARALREDEPSVASTGITNDDDPALAQRLAVPQIIHGLQASRRALEELLDGRDDASLERAIVHERDGRVTARALVEKAVAHEREHAAAVARIAQAAPDASRVIIPLAPRG
ncbi:MAG TPA: DinB family protein [Dehalococcoidia bacterium]|nr:DinB family protein [Dehalococcoidia bacterium]